MKVSLFVWLLLYIILLYVRIDEGRKMVEKKIMCMLFIYNFGLIDDV